jgi:hypothetical protein
MLGGNPLGGNPLGGNPLGGIPLTIPLLTNFLRHNETILYTKLFSCLPLNPVPE